LNIAKHRLLTLVGWMACSFLFVILGWIGGAGIGYLCEFMGWVEYPDVMFSGLTFLIFPFIGGIIGLIVMHIIRTLCWIKLHHSYMMKYEKWTWKYTMGIVLLDELLWLMVFTAICVLLTIVL